MHNSRGGNGMETQLLPCCGLFYSDAGQWISQTLLIDSDGTTLNFPHRKNAAAVLWGQQRCQLQGFRPKERHNWAAGNSELCASTKRLQKPDVQMFFSAAGWKLHILVEPVRRLKSRINTKTWMSSWPCRVDRINCDSCFAHSNSPQPALLLVIGFFFLIYFLFLQILLPVRSSPPSSVLLLSCSGFPLISRLATHIICSILNSIHLPSSLVLHMCVWVTCWNKNGKTKPRQPKIENCSDIQHVTKMKLIFHYRSCELSLNISYSTENLASLPIFRRFTRDFVVFIIIPCLWQQNNCFLCNLYSILNTST